MNERARPWSDTGYAPERDPAALREREMIDALREHTQALRASRSQGMSPAPEERSSVHLIAREETPASRAEFISQHTAEAILGLTPRQFLDLLRRGDAPPVSAVGKLRLVRRDAMVAFLDRLGARAHVAHEVDGADAVLREIGCAPVRGH